MKNWKQFCLLTGAVVMAGCGQKKAKEHEKPNFLLFISDDQTWVHAGAYGCENVSTPYFDRVAREGLLFNNAFCAAPQCSVSRASLLTGRNPWQLEEAGTHFSNFPAKFKVYPDILEEHGYLVGYTGKGWSPGKWDVSGRERNPAGNRYSEYELDTLPARYLHRNDPVRNFEDFLTGRKEGQPFCFWYGSIEPHVPYERGIGLKNGIDTSAIKLPGFIPDHPGAKIEMSDYLFEIQWFDKQVGRMLRYLENQGLDKNTVIIVTSDNGIVLPRCKRNLYEWGTHMPLAIKWPQMAKKGRKTDRLISFIDLAPTMLDLAGIQVPGEMTGQSFAGLLTGEGDLQEEARTSVLTGFERHDHKRYDNLGYPMRAIRTERYLFIRNYKPDRWPEGNPEIIGYGRESSEPGNSSWTNQYSYFEPGSKLFERAFGKRPPEELYDIINDPECLHDLAGKGKFRAMADSLNVLLTNFLYEQEDPREHGYGDVFESYPRYGRMNPDIGGFKERGEYNLKYQASCNEEQ